MIHSDARERALKWLEPHFDQDTQLEVSKLLNSNEELLTDSFYKDLEFGTGGMRGLMGVGTNRLNKYTLGKNAQGLSNYLKTEFPDQQISVAIAYDCRHNSDIFSQTVANVLSANGIKVYLFDELRPTPLLSYTVRSLQCHCGIVLTASHNPPEYNGFKVYWQDGGQLVPPQDKGLLSEINTLNFNEINFSAQADLIHRIGTELDEKFYVDALKNGSLGSTSLDKDNIKIVFTSLHGTSITMVPEILKRAGFRNVHIVKEQAMPDGDFPTVASPNPEEPDALKMAMEQAQSIGANIVIGTDPDSDRIGIAVRNQEGQLELLNGNQTMVVMTDFLLQKAKNNHAIKNNSFIASTVVSSPMMLELGKLYGVECLLGLTGFKWIAKMIKDFPQRHFIGGGEESYGFMVGDFVRDKDAVTAALLACDIVAVSKSRGGSFYQHLINLYTKTGCYQERLISITKKGAAGLEEISTLMSNARLSPPKMLGGQKVVKMEDFQSSQSLDILSQHSSPIDHPKSNVLIFYAEDGSMVAMRPSGTEPKIKYYISVNCPLPDASDYGAIKTVLLNKIDLIALDLESLR
ncbi:MAG: phospho-sugar mutase [Bacteroidetes bacterium]|nr:phospho-sugar mutase [Bacteroidota bacterium]MDA0878857.1 phospho-sugar mutase [Bacteroidota bacterium]MDA1115155.1 phospho-sugar mutase [Bacteroidota bacterium]